MGIWSIQRIRDKTAQLTSDSLETIAELIIEQEDKIEELEAAVEKLQELVSELEAMQ